MIYYNNDIAMPFSFYNKTNNTKVSVRGIYVNLQSIINNLINRFYNKLPSNLPLVEETFLQTVALAVLLASNFKFNGIFKLQLTCYNSALKAILVDVKSTGEVRGLFSVSSDVNFPNTITFAEMVGNGYMIFHIQNNINVQPYQAIIGLEKDSLIKNAQHWFNQSEQTLTSINLFTNLQSKQAGALFIQALPEKDINNIEQALEDFNTISTLCATANSAEFFGTTKEELLFRLFNEYNIVMHKEKLYKYKCSCNKAKVSSLLKQLNEKANTLVECNFCGKAYN